MYVFSSEEKSGVPCKFGTCGAELLHDFRQNYPNPTNIHKETPLSINTASNRCSSTSRSQL